MAKGQRHEHPTEESVLQTIKSRSTQNLPDGSLSHNTLLKKGPQTYKAASLLEIVSPNSGRIAKRRLTIADYKFRVSGGIDFENPTAHWACEDDAIENLRIFLSSVTGIETDGDHAIVKMDPAQQGLLQGIIAALDEGQFDVHQLSGLISALAERADDLKHATQAGIDDHRRMVAAALRAAHRTDALQELRRHIRENALEQSFQTLLTKNWWMLGGRYIQLIPRRDWTVRETVDIMLQTADGYFEIIELKRANASTFTTDHGHAIVSSDVNRAVNQAAHYISEIESSRDNLNRRYGFDPYKLRAKVLIGHIAPNDPQSKLKREALRCYNSHLHGIEVLTYDQIERIAEHVIDANIIESETEQQNTLDAEESEDIPF